MTYETKNIAFHIIHVKVSSNSWCPRTLAEREREREILKNWKVDYLVRFCCWETSKMLSLEEFQICDLVRSHILPFVLAFPSHGFSMCIGFQLRSRFSTSFVFLLFVAVFFSFCTQYHMARNMISGHRMILLYNDVNVLKSLVGIWRMHSDMWLTYSF